jgi:hypothetical protein
MAVKSLIQTVTVGAGGAASIEFTDIVQESGSDLFLVLSLRGNFGVVSYNGQVNFNNDTAGNYSSRFLFGDGSSVGSLSISAGASALRPFIAGSSSTANTFSNSSFYVSNYASAVAKSVSIDNVTENKATEAHESIFAGIWTGTTGITSIKVANGFTLVQHSTASLYKIKYD